MKSGHYFSQASAPVISAASLGDSILLIVALCFHSVFEGIAIGVAETKADAWKALWTVCLHMIFAAIAMGTALLRTIPDCPLLSCAAYAFAFAICSPIGEFVFVFINHLQSKGYRLRRSYQWTNLITNF